MERRGRNIEKFDKSRLEVAHSPKVGFNPEKASDEEFEAYVKAQTEQARIFDTNGSKDDADDIRAAVQALQEKRRQGEAQH